MNKIQILLDEIRILEQSELTHAMFTKGKKIEDWYVYEFKGEYPIVAAYSGEDPCDVVVLSVKMDKNGWFVFNVDEKLNRGNEHIIQAKDIFAGQLEFITSEIV